MYQNQISKAHLSMRNIIKKTPLEYCDRLSKTHNCNVFLKREDLQLTRSFKIRGATNKIMNNLDLAKSKGIVCASAGNHAQGVAYLCKKFNINGTVFIPNNTPLQKKNRIEFFGQENITVKNYGNNFNLCLDRGLSFCKNEKKLFIHPFDDIDVINGQATIAYEIYNELKPDYLMCCIGGGGLISGISQYFNSVYDRCNIIGIEPEGAASATEAIKNNIPTQLDNIDTFVDGGAVSKIGNINFDIIKNNVDEILTVPNEKIANILTEFYEYEGIILEPAGALGIAGLDGFRFKKKDNVVCVLSGGNNDITRYQEIMDLNLRYLNRKHYFIIQFIQKPRQLTSFMEILDKGDDITRFEYIKKTNKNFGDVLICIETDNIDKIINKLNSSDFNYTKINPDSLIYNYLI